MEKKEKTQCNPLLNKHLYIFLFFTFFFTFSLKGYTLPTSDASDTLITGDRTKDSIRSIEFFNMGRKLLDSLADYEGALEYFLKCLDIRKHLFDKNDEEIAFAENRVGATYRNLGRLNEAIKHYQEVIRINTHNFGENYYRNGSAYNNIGNVYQHKGNFKDAIKYQTEAIEHFQLGLSENSGIQLKRLKSNIITAKYNVANNLYHLKQYDQAVNLIRSCYQNAAYDDKADFLTLLGNIYIALNDETKAKNYFIQSIEEMRRNASNTQDSIKLAILHVSYAEFLIKENDSEEAKSNLIQAGSLLTDTFHGTDISDFYNAYGDLYSHKQFDSNSLGDFRKIKTDHLDTALGYYQKAIITLCDSFTNPNPSSNPLIAQCRFPSRTLEILQNKAETYYQLAQLDQAKKEQMLTELTNSLAASGLASDLLNNLRTGTVSEESKIDMTQLQNSIYLFSIKTANELFRLSGQPEYFETALQNAERNKAASLLDNLTDEHARKASFLPDSLTQREENINDQISVINQDLFNEEQLKNPDSLKIQHYNNQLFQLNHDKNDLENYLEENFSDYYRLKYADNKMSIKEIQDKIAEDEVILEYTYDGLSNQDKTHDLYLFLVSKNDFELKEINVDSTYHNEINTVYQFLAAPDFVNIPLKKYNNYLSSAYNLYKLLIQPVENKLRGRIVTIIPDGRMSYIPFDALLYNKPAQVTKLDFKNLDYLIKKFTFNYSYSANLYLNKFNTEKRAGKELLAFAPQYGEFNKNADAEFNQLPPLTGIMNEVKGISEQIKSRVFAGDEATESNFRKNYSNYDILHLAMHAIINDSVPMFSKLAFAPENDSVQSEDGWLTTSEIYNLRLNARLSVLSACNTGSGVLREGEGVISLARGFFYAGCPSVVMTLWEVEDRSGASIMEDFYRFLKAGKKKPVALRLAKLKHLKDSNPVSAHPHVWLSYVTIGNSDALYASNDYYFFIAILIILAAIAIDQLYKNKKARRNRA